MELTYVGELSPIDVEKLNTKQALTALFNGVVQTHACLEKHIAEQTLANLTATEKRQELASQVLDIREGQVKMLLALGVEKPAPGEPVPAKAKTVLPLVEHIKVLGVVGGSLAGVGALYKFIVAVWPAVSAYLLSVAK